MPDRTVIEWDKNDLDELGLLKVDVLALGMLSAIRRALWEEHEFDERLPGLEDVAWAKHWLERGLRVVYEPDAGPPAAIATAGF